MQKAFVAIVFALALTSAVADYTPFNYVKNCTQAVQDSDTNFTTADHNQGIKLTSVATGELYLMSNNFSTNIQNQSQSTWAVWLKKLDAKTLSAGTNASYTFTTGLEPFFGNNYAIGLLKTNESGIWQAVVIQQQLTGGAPLPRLTITTNANASYGIGDVTYQVVGKNFHFVYEGADKKLNVSTFTIGGSVGTNEYQLTTAYTGGLQSAWGEAISTSQIFVSWQEGDVLKDAVVDASKGSLVGSVSTVGSYQKNYTCSPYVTDKKDYGEICYINSASGENKTTTYYTRANTTAALTTYAAYNTNTSAYYASYPYGPYLIVTFSDSVASNTSTTYHYEIWNLETGANFRNRTQYLQITSNSTHIPFRVTSGGLYSLLYTRTNTSAPYTNVQVGMLLGGSYLTSVLGFLMTIIAGLLFF